MKNSYWPLSGHLSCHLNKSSGPGARSSVTGCPACIACHLSMWPTGMGLLAERGGCVEIAAQVWTLGESLKPVVTPICFLSNWWPQPWFPPSTTKKSPNKLLVSMSVSFFRGVHSVYIDGGACPLLQGTSFTDVPQLPCLQNGGIEPAQLSLQSWEPTELMDAKTALERTKCHIYKHRMYLLIYLCSFVFQKKDLR